MASGMQPGRPYGSSEDLDGNAGRQGEFTTGATQTGDLAGNSAINADSARFNALVPRQFSQHSVLQTAMPSANGLSAQDAERMLPGGQPGQSVMLPTQNGSSADTYEKAIYMRLAGLDEG